MPARDLPLAHAERLPRQPAGGSPLCPGDYDLAALVILPHDTVLFTAVKQEIHRVPCRSVEGLRAHPYASLQQALGDPGLPSRGPPYSRALIPHP